jgi:hypothetical protein
VADIAIPKIGQLVKVFTSYSLNWMNEYNRPITGIVVPGNLWDQPNTFRLHPSDQGIGKKNGDSTISIDRVTRIEYLDGSQDTQKSTKALSGPSKGEESPEFFEVDGSKGARYTVTKRGDTFSCNCVAGGFGRQCKHVTKIKDQLV